MKFFMDANDEVLISVMERVKGFILEMMEENDRAIVIVGAANIDFLLRRLIEQSLLPRLDKGKDELLDNDSPLSSFSSRINFCYRLGLVDKEFCRLLHILRRIRNDFAHNIKSCDLNSSPRSDRVGEICEFLKNSMLLIELRKFFPSNGPKMHSRDFRIMLSLFVSLLEMKLHHMPKIMKANPVAISWIPLKV